MHYGAVAVDIQSHSCLQGMESAYAEAKGIGQRQATRRVHILRHRMGIGTMPIGLKLEVDQKGAGIGTVLYLVLLDMWYFSDFARQEYRGELSHI